MQGLALRGPVGSMVRAIDGMIADQFHVMSCFTMTLCFFTVNIIAMCWVMWEPINAIIGTAIITLGTIYWYRVLMTIYNRFKFSGMEKYAWHEDPGKIAASETFMGGIFDEEDNPVSSHVTGEATAAKATAGEAAASVPDNPNHTAMGFLTVKINSRSSLFFGGGSPTWNRYFVVVNKSFLIYYHDKSVYELTPNITVKKRPVNVSGYDVFCEVVEEPPFEIVVAPQAKGPHSGKAPIELRCDSVAEMMMWNAALKKAASCY